jgi:ABC-type multidrug transport system ATPase subunit
MANFSIIALRVLPDNPENIRKIFPKEGDWYLFNQSYERDNNKLKCNEKYLLKDDDNFFTENISINAIVGKNGSGKSSLLDLLFRIVYNLSVQMRLLNPFEKEEVKFIPFNAELYFVANNVFYGLKNDDICVRIFKQNLNTTFELDTSAIKWEIKIKKDDLENLFYSIVVNYSMQAYLSNDYMDNEQTNSWIDYLFHKNDGYLTPIVLNPKRDYGTVDMNNEYDLSIQRLSSLLIDNHQFIDGYELNNITAKYNHSKVTKKFTQHTVAKISNFHNSFQYYDDSIFYKILDAYGITYPYTEKAVERYQQNNQILQQNSNAINPQTLSLIPEPIDTAYHYLVLKTISISNTYDNYEKFKINIDTRKDNLLQDELNEIPKSNIKGLVEKIKEDSSHVTLKIKQVINFIEYTKKNTITKDKLLTYNYLNGSSLYEKNIDLSYLDRIIAALPPSFYKSEIQFNNEITLAKMSSGERQFLFSMSTVLYHIKNLMSVSDNDNERVKYKNFNIVLDEIELCFHPEYQREFVNRLIDYISRLDSSKEYNFNIILSTHSPFILSDIPKCNIIYLDKGKQIPNKKIPETFSANIHDILRHSFFLENGFIGEFAKCKIEEIIKIIKPIIEKNSKIKNDKRKYISDENYKKCKKLIDLIGEPLIKQKLMMMMSEVYDNNKIE